MRLKRSQTDIGQSIQDRFGHESYTTNMSDKWQKGSTLVEEASLRLEIHEMRNSDQRKKKKNQGYFQLVNSIFNHGKPYSIVHKPTPLFYC